MFQNLDVHVFDISCIQIFACSYKKILCFISAFNILLQNILITVPNSNTN